MKKKIVGYGAGGHSGVIIDILEDNNEFEIEGLIDKIKLKKNMDTKLLEMNLV